MTDSRATRRRAAGARLPPGQQSRKPEPHETGITDLKERPPPHRREPAQVGSTLVHLGISRTLSVVYAGSSAYQPMRQPMLNNCFAKVQRMSAGP